LTRLINRYSYDFNNPRKIKEWYLKIHEVFNHIMIKNNWSKTEAWHKLKIELINTVGSKNFVPDDLDWIKGILLNDKEPTTEECLRVAKKISK